MNYIIKETTVWGHFYKAKNIDLYRRLKQKYELSNRYPFTDHSIVYAFKPENQRGPARENQTFIVAYPYVYDDFIGNKETEFINQLTSINLRFYKEPCIFKGKNAYKIFIMDTEVDLDLILRLVQVPI